jgi:hypothetical protein
MHHPGQARASLCNAAEVCVHDRFLTSAVLIILGTVFCSYGISQLFAAYRTNNSAVWIEKAIIGGAGTICAGLLVDLAIRLLR